MRRHKQRSRRNGKRRFVVVGDSRGSHMVVVAHRHSDRGAPIYSFPFLTGASKNQSVSSQFSQTVECIQPCYLRVAFGIVVAPGHHTDSELVEAIDRDLRKILINPNARDPFVLGGETVASSYSKVLNSTS